MEMVRVFAGLVVLLAALAAPGGVSAGVITDYNGVTVVKSAGTDECGIRAEADFRDRLQKGLADKGVALDGAAAVHAQLTVDAKSFSALEGKCLIFVRLAFFVPVEAKFVEIDKAANNREAVVAVFEEIDEISAMIYEDNEFNAAWPMNAHDEALYLVDQLALRFGGRK
jgi:hypothetical protein